MAQKTKIEWCHHTLNLWWGCTEVHEGCDNCYARTWAKRFGVHWGNNEFRQELKHWRKDLMTYQRQAAKENEMRYVLVGSMMDIFERPKSLMDNKKNPQGHTTGDIRDELFTQMVNKCTNLIFLFLTKRPSNINKYIPEDWKQNPPQNVMFGTSPVTQETADKLIPQLLQVNGYRFLSVEPQLEELDLTQWLSKIDWVIVGGESGNGRRAFNPDWARKIRTDCNMARVEFFMKQIDKVIPVPKDLHTREFPSCFAV